VDRRMFNRLACLAVFDTMIESVGLEAEQATSVMDEVVLEDNELRVAFDRHSGALVRMERKSTRWMIEQRLELGVSFRLLAPLPGHRGNFVLGQKQKAASVDKISANQVRLRWENLNSEHGGVFPSLSRRR
jgi:hypothetical protein